MKKIYFLVLFSLNIFLSKAQSLSDSATVSLLTISPGTALYSTFGHSAFRIKDPNLGIDQNYNYGSFNTDTPDFYLKFLRGQLPYKISSYPFYLEFDYWTKHENRGVKEQVLNLSKTEKQAIFEFLNNNLRPENAEYAYKFFYDNCSTRLRDILQKTLGKKLILDQKLHADSTYRQWIHKYSFNNNLHWADFGMSLAIGLPADSVTGHLGAYFLPDVLHDGLDKAKFSDSNEPLVKEEKLLWETSPSKNREFFTPILLFSIFLILVLILTYFEFKNKISLKIFDLLFFNFLGLSGLILFLLWFFTNHGVTENNLNLMWCPPVLFGAYSFIKNTGIFKLWGYLLLIFLVLMPFLPQGFPISVYLIIICIIIRIFSKSLNTWKK